MRNRQRLRKKLGTDAFKLYNKFVYLNIFLRKLVLGRIITFLSLIFIVVTIVSCTHSGDSSDRNVPNDQELLGIFQTHHDAIAKLQQMAGEDLRHEWCLGISDLKLLDESRRQEYGRL